MKQTENVVLLDPGILEQTSDWQVWLKADEISNDDHKAEVKFCSRDFAVSARAIVNRF